MLTCDVTIHALKKEKKRKGRKHKRGFGNVDPNPHLEHLVNHKRIIQAHNVLISDGAKISI